PKRLSLVARVAIVVATLVVGLALVKVVPGAVTWRIRWLTNDYTGSADPQWDITVDGAAIRRAATYVPRGDTAAVWFPPSSPQYSHDLPAAAVLFLTPAKLAGDPATATWVLSYDADTLVPPGVQTTAKYELAPGIFLVRTNAA